MTYYTTAKLIQATDARHLAWHDLKASTVTFVLVVVWRGVTRQLE